MTPDQTRLIEKFAALPSLLQAAVKDAGTASPSRYAVGLNSGAIINFRGAQIDRQGWLRLLAAQPLGADAVNNDCIITVRVEAISWASIAEPSAN